MRARAARIVERRRHERASEWAARLSISGRTRCGAQSLHNWVMSAERDVGKWAVPEREERCRIKALERNRPASPSLVWSATSPSD